MGERHSLNSSLQGDNNDQGRQLAEQPYIQLATTGTPERSNYIYTMNNMRFEGEQQHNSASMSVGYSSSSIDAELQHYHLVHLSGGSLNMVPGSYSHHATSSNHNGQVFQRVNDGFLEPNNRGHLKRRNPGFPVIRERGSTSRFSDAGSSSEHFIPPPPPPPPPTNPQFDSLNSDYYHPPWNCVNLYRDIGLSIGDDEGHLRNVRSRPSFDPENNQAHAPVSNPPPLPPFTMNFDNPSSMGFLSANLTVPSYHVVNGNPGAALWMGGGPVNDSFSNRNAATQSLHDLSGHQSNGVRSSYVQGHVPTFGTQFAEDNNHASRYPRISGRNRISGDRYRTFEGARIRDRLMNQNSGINVSRSMFDQHRDMRLDIDNMSYEELAALVERIGDVNTGLSDDLFRKCLTELIYCSSSDHVQDEERCVICLEEYKHMDDIGTLKKCGHDYHVECIKKWLSFKNLCPICKAPALDDSMMNK